LPRCSARQRGDTGACSSGSAYYPLRPSLSWRRTRAARPRPHCLTHASPHKGPAAPISAVHYLERRQVPTLKSAGGYGRLVNAAVQGVIRPRALGIHYCRSCTLEVSCAKPRVHTARPYPSHPLIHHHDGHPQGTHPALRSSASTSANVTPTSATNAPAPPTTA